MTSRTTAALVTGAVAVPAFLLAPVLFAPNPSRLAPASGQPLFLIGSLLLGVGVAFIAHSWRHLRGGHAQHARAVCIPLAWLMLSAYPHAGLMAGKAVDLLGILVHLPVFVCPLVLVWGVLGLQRERATTGSPL